MTSGPRSRGLASLWASEPTPHRPWCSAHSEWSAGVHMGQLGSMCFRLWPLAILSCSAHRARPTERQQSGNKARSWSCWVRKGPKSKNPASPTRDPRADIHPVISHVSPHPLQGCISQVLGQCPACVHTRTHSSTCSLMSALATQLGPGEGGASQKDTGPAAERMLG